MVLLIAHRGFRVGVLENTFEAFSLALARGMDYIELDVQLSADREALVLHDATLDRTMGVAGKLADMTAVQIGAINATRGDAGVPRFSDVIRRVLLDPGPGARTRLMVELKGKGTGEVAAALVLASHVEDRVTFSSQNLDELGIAHDAAPSVPLCLNITYCMAFPPR